MTFQRRNYTYPNAIRDEVRAANAETLEALKQEWLSRSMFGLRGGTVTWYMFAYPHAHVMLLDEATKKEDAHREAFYAEEITRAKQYYGVTK